MNYLGADNIKVFSNKLFLYSVGMQTIFLMATFSEKVKLILPQDKLIMTLLLIQIEAIIGAVFFSKLSKKIGNKKCN